VLRAGLVGSGLGWDAGAGAGAGAGVGLVYRFVHIRAPLSESEAA
jgi:hypothetical protein